MVESRLETAINCLVYKKLLIYGEKNNDSPKFRFSVKDRQICLGILASKLCLMKYYSA